MVLPDLRSDSDVKALKFASAANFVAAAVMIPWVALITALCVAGAIAGWDGGGDAAGRNLAVLVGAVGLAFLWGAAALHLIVGWCLVRRRGYRFALALSGITALNPTCLPISLVVAALTWHALWHPSVKAAFDAEVPRRNAARRHGC